VIYNKYINSIPGARIWCPTSFLASGFKSKR
jgi:hypothetical protein